MMGARIRRHFESRSARRQRLVAELYRAGPRPVLEALIAVDEGVPLDTVLADFMRVPARVYRDLGADRLAIDEVRVIAGGRA